MGRWVSLNSTSFIQLWDFSSCLTKKDVHNPLGARAYVGRGRSIHHIGFSEYYKAPDHVLILPTLTTNTG